MSVTQNNHEYSSEKILCQKLFYNEHTVVDATYVAKENIALGNN